MEVNMLDTEVTEQPVVCIFGAHIAGLYPPHTGPGVGGAKLAARVCALQGEVVRVRGGGGGDGE